MSSFLRGHKEAPGGSAGLFPCLVNTSAIRFVFPKKSFGGVAVMGPERGCIAVLDDGSVIEMDIAFRDLEDICAAATRAQVAAARESLRI